MAKDATFRMAVEFMRSGGETEKAIRVMDPVSGEWHWIPFSQITEIARNPDGQSGEVEMSEWIAKQKGFYS